METTESSFLLSTEHLESDDASSEWKTWVFSMILLNTALGTPTNLLLLISYVKNPELQNPSNLLLLNQGIADLLSCVMSTQYAFINYTDIGFHLASVYKYFCLTGLCSTTLTLWASLFNLLCISIDRLMNIQFPFHYARLVTENRIKWGIAVLWMVMLVIHGIPMFGVNTWRPHIQCSAAYVLPQFYFINLFLLPSLLVLISVGLVNLAICGIVISKRRVAPGGAEPQQQQQQQKSQYKLTKMILVVVGIFYACWFPYTTITALVLLKRSSWFASGFSQWMLCLIEVCKVPLVVNGSLNPLIYVWKNRQFRRAFRKTLRLPVNESTTAA
ncbi:hypothetical protein CAPTEDRAFT_203526 [Capitella teleta]|uniref:G-protein coupled receptors family 1 profile domain-containing protein n=1 Tax=Capitella teleta TaxID=283909 RepID=R7ULI6_CAPTE|nr:hypothetical protein CAPTEDRAFT_203526 [Capitella teleta]|eukprot:ELU06958.1 hypothetical protein CAPTEDRAFT_203526 [Capitella teleta]